MKKIKEIIKSFSLLEKSIFSILIVIFITTLISILHTINLRYSVELPQRGGRLTEGILGTPRLINPLLAISETDRSIVNLVYSGLLRNTSSGLVNDLAESYTVSEDGLTYTVNIKDSAEFHDGTKVTADDIVFTVLTAQNPELRSPKRSNWEGVSVEKRSDTEIVFKLSQPYAPFLQNLTIGILPRHIWGEIEVNEFSLSKYNSEPIGSGPYMIDRISKDEIGIPKQYTLIANPDYTLNRPYIDQIVLKIYKSQEAAMEAYLDGDIDSLHSVDPSEARSLQIDGERVEDYPLPRIFGLFFNQSASDVIADQTVREALRLATPKTEIVDEVLSGFGSIIDSPIPHHLVDVRTEERLVDDIEAARNLLLEDGWELNESGKLVFPTSNSAIPLRVSISTSNVSELKNTSEMVRNAWEEMGAEVELQIFEASDLNPNVIRPRKFEVLLFGIVTGRDLDLYPFWHSSQRDDPGLNITSYTNISVDEILETLRVTQDNMERQDLLAEFNENIREDIPAIFIYSPDFIYILPEKLGGVDITNITSSEERYMEVHNWYLNTDYVWKIFSK